MRRTAHVTAQRYLYLSIILLTLAAAAAGGVWWWVADTYYPINGAPFSMTIIGLGCLVWGISYLRRYFKLRSWLP